MLTTNNEQNASYKPARNDDCLNIHNPQMLSICSANVYCQLVTSKKFVLNYISKYASKTEIKSKSYSDILKRIANIDSSEEKALLAYQKIMMNIIINRDIGAQESCHMLRKLPLVTC